MESISEIFRASGYSIPYLSTSQPNPRNNKIFPLVETTEWCCMSEIFEFYIITDSGLCIYSYSPRANFDGDEITGLFTALNWYAQEVTSESIRSFSFPNSKVVFFHAKDVYLVARTLPQAKEEETYAWLEKMYQIFASEISPETCKSNWNECRNHVPDLGIKFEKYF